MTAPLDLQVSAAIFERPTLGAVSTIADGCMLAALELLEAVNVPIAPAHFVRADGRCSCGNAECSSPGKHPRFKAWQRAALRDAEAIRKHWQQYPHDNFGFPTGSASGIVVLDVDGAAGEASLAAHVERHGALPLCPTVITARGRHLYFAAGSLRLRNTQGTHGARALGAGLDLRGEGGFVMLPPSVHASGHVYRWG